MCSSHIQVNFSSLLAYQPVNHSLTAQQVLTYMSVQCWHAMRMLCVSHLICTLQRWTFWPHWKFTFVNIKCLCPLSSVSIATHNYALRYCVYYLNAVVCTVFTFCIAVCCSTSIYLPPTSETWAVPRKANHSPSWSLQLSKPKATREGGLLFSWESSQWWLSLQLLVCVELCFMPSTRSPAQLPKSNQWRVIIFNNEA